MVHYKNSQPYAIKFLMAMIGMVEGETEAKANGGYVGGVGDGS